jgi:hypothetical protein
MTRCSRKGIPELHQASLAVIGCKPSNQKCSLECGSSLWLRRNGDNDQPNLQHMNITMTLLIRPLLRPIACIRTAIQPVQRQHRYFSASSPCSTDGVYSELTAMRTRTPFIEAFRKEQESKSNAHSASSAHILRSEPAPSLSPKSMSDSYHRVVSHVTSDFMSDNSQGCSYYLWLGTLGSWIHT